MVKNNSITSLTRNGLRDWFIQRLTAVYLALGFIILIGYLISHPLTDYYSWQQLFSSEWVRIVTFLFFVSLAAHAWIGIWTVITDYIKCAALRLTVLIAVWLVLIPSLVWSAVILWGQ